LETGNWKLDNHTLIKKSWNSKHRIWGVITAVFVFLTFFTLLSPKPSFAAEDEALDEIISGFDDKKPEASADTMQDVLEGFEDEPKDAKESKKQR
jgi:hypothetical protein